MFNWILSDVAENPIKHAIASVSVGIYNQVPVLDLDYAEDSSADTDMNIVMNDRDEFIELQGTAEGHCFNSQELQDMIAIMSCNSCELKQ